MAVKRVTMQDIAEACGLSRNTVSKIFNGRGSVPEGTRKLVLDKAQELGYLLQPKEAERAGGVIAVFAQQKLLSHNFGAFFITSFTDQISRAGYTIQMYKVSAAEIQAKKLPPHFRLEETAGILGIELFDRAYIKMICRLGKPTVFVDGYARMSAELMQCDSVSMENLGSEAALVRRMIESGAKRIGFVGDYEHCGSFFERWSGYSLAMLEAGLTVDRALCILEKDSEDYGRVDWLLERLDAMPTMPEGFACANDYLAIHLMAALKQRGLKVPGDVMLTGFDGSMESKVVEPTLTTAEIPSSRMGRLAARLLCERIQDGDAPFRRTLVKTTPIWGGSTR